MISKETSGITLPEVHGMRKNLDRNILPEKQHSKPIKGKGMLAEKPCIGQGRVGRRRVRPSPINQNSIQPSELSQKIPGVTKIGIRITNSIAPAHSINNANDRISHRRPLTPDILFYPGPTYRPPPKPIRSPMSGSHEGTESSKSSESLNISPEINIDFKRILYFRKELFQTLTKDLISHSFKNLKNYKA